MDPADIAGLRTLLRQQQFADVLIRGEALLAAEPGQRDVLLCVAVALRCLGRHAESLATLQVLEQHHPRFSRLYEERGRCRVELKDAPQAIAAFEQAVAINHSLPGSWRMLAGLYRMTGRTDQAAVAAEQLAALEQVPPEVVTAAALFADRELDAAEGLVRAYLLQHGDQVEAMRLLAAIGIDRKVFDDAEILLAAVLERDPGNRFAPKAVAVIGASRSPEKVGHAVLANLVNGGFKGAIVPVNPGTDEILGLKCYKSLGEYEC